MLCTVSYVHVERIHFSFLQLSTIKEIQDITVSLCADQQRKEKRRNSIKKKVFVILYLKRTFGKEGRGILLLKEL